MLTLTKNLLCWTIGPPLLRWFNKFRVSGLENIPLSGRAILAANHGSYLDPILLFYITTRQFYAVTVDFLFKIWWLAWVLRATDCIPTKDAIHGALAKLNQDKLILIFPEGGCKKCREVVIDRIHRGVAVFALKTGSPVVPIGIKGTFDAWPCTKILPSFGKKFEVNIGKPLLFDRYDKDAPIPDEVLMPVLNKIEEEIKKLLC